MDLSAERLYYAAWFPNELENKKRLLSDRYLSRKKSDEQPTAILLGGQPASGKTKLIRYLNTDAETDFVVINGDTYRELHPRYEQIQDYYGQDAPDKTQPFSNALVEFMKEECLRRKLSFVIEGTMRTYTVIESTAKQAREHGFQVEAHVLAIHSDDSYLGIFQRYEGEMAQTCFGRFSPLSSHDEAYRQIPANVQKASEQQLFDQISVYYRDETDSVQVAHSFLKKDLTDYLALFAQLRQPQRTADFYHQAWQTIEKQAMQRGETKVEYLTQIRDFCNQYSPERLDT